MAADESQCALPPREQILRAAATVFSVDGYSAGSINDVAAAAKMSRQRLMHYFPTKRTLLLAVLDDRDARLTLRLDEPENITLDDFMARFDRLFPEIYADEESMRLAHKLAAEAIDPGHPAHQWIVERQRRIRAELEGVLAAAVRRMELPPSTNTRGLAVALLAVAEGVEGQWLVDRDVDWRAAIEMIGTMLRAVMSTAQICAGPHSG